MLDFKFSSVWFFGRPPYEYCLTEEVACRGSCCRSNWRGRVSLDPMNNTALDPVPDLLKALKLYPERAEPYMVQPSLSEAYLAFLHPLYLVNAKQKQEACCATSMRAAVLLQGLPLALQMTRCAPAVIIVGLPG